MNVYEFSDKVQAVSEKALRTVEKAIDNLDPTNTSGESIKNIYMMSSSLASISKSQADLERSCRDRSVLLAEANEAIKSEFRRLLSAEPELVGQILNILDSSTANLIRLNEANPKKVKRLAKG